ncbi:MAG: hypothetical protein V4683_00510 [Bacteroidota bacterium]
MKVKYGIAIFSLVMLACSQKPNFPLEPSITMSGIANIKVLDKNSSTPTKQIFKDSVSISINFKDGNGDLGVNEADKNKLSEKGEFNYLVRRFIRIKGKYIEFNPIPSHSGNFVTLKSGTKPGPIEGVINYALEFLPLNGTKKDTIKFEIKIVDRAKNASNAVMTDSVLVNELNKKSIILN